MPKTIGEARRALYNAEADLKYAIRSYDDLKRNGGYGNKLQRAKETMDALQRYVSQLKSGLGQ